MEKRSSTIGELMERRRTVESCAEKRSTERPSVLADLKSKSEHILPAKRSEGREEVL